ncbi:ComEC/Rec2 family competence protein [Natronococcus wangiae]|uniref:ComEC/Rec2 family competence protein n=1 Tax=Natronococcus wangiae TaxID=3068275 RepID=UPI00273E8CDA|nr:ComEC/Rec2 family competence protein [Natronococcus sp. AD5]
MRRALVVVTVVGLLVLGGCIGGTGVEDGADQDEDEGVANEGVETEGELEIHHIDVGQADATLLITPDGETVLIDTGDWRNDGRDVIEYLEARGVDRIDHLVATHAHADHIGGHAAVIEHFEERGEGVGAAYDSGVVHTSATFDDYLDAVEEHDVGLFQVEDGDDLPLEDGIVDATVLNPPEGDPGDEIDDNGVALVAEFGSFSYLTTGDAGRDAERRLVDDRSGALEADAYQAGHHGSSTSSIEPFLEAADPQVAIVSSAGNSQYGHPHDEALERFADREIETYWTAVHGDVVLTTDGEETTVTAERDASTDPMDLLEKKYDEERASPGEPAASHPSIDPARAPLSG